MKPRTSWERELVAWPKQTEAVPELRRRVDLLVQMKKKSRRKKTVAAATVLALFVGLFLGVPYVRDTASLQTPVATRSTFTLEDGSQAQLNARTQLHADFRYHRRVVTIAEGEAFFSVAKDPAHPFVIHTPGGTIQVTGTQFNVRLTGDGRTEVTLLEGHVNFATPGQADVRSLQPGEQIKTDGTLRTLSHVQMTETLAWRDGYLALEGLTLADAMTRVSAFHGKEIRVDASIASLPTGGTYPLADLPAFLRALESVFPVRAVPDGDSYRLLPR
jgi:transmembrane sensor